MTREEIIELADKLKRISGEMHWQLLHDSAEAIRELVRQRDELLAALENAVSVAKTAHECWDNDQDMKVGKYLIALSGGLPGYDKRTDEIHAAIASVKGQA